MTKNRVFSTLALVAVFVLSLSSPANAETEPASWGGKYISADYPAIKYDSAASAFTGSFPAHTNYKICAFGSNISAGSVGVCGASYGGTGQAYAYSWNGYFWTAYQIQFISTWVCPSGQNWTLSGSSCVRPDCVLPNVRDSADGVCKPPADPCLGKETQPAVIGWYPSAVGTPSLESSQYCSGGCTVALNASPTGTQYANKTTRWQQYAQVQLGFSCASGLGTAPAAGLPDKSPPEPPKVPVCPAGDGVLTSSSGAVHCVPSGTPGSAPPIVSKTQQIQNFPDGSKKITDTTTTRDPQTGAEEKNQNITNTPSTAGGTGEAGTPGTTTNKTASSTNDGGDPTKPGDSDFCAKNPGLQICKGGISEEKTQREIRDLNKEIKDLLDPKDPANTDSVNQEKDSYEQKANAHKDFIDAYAAKAQNDEGFLSWAWIPEVPATSCVPFSGLVGGKTIALDWCEQLGMVRDIAGYMFYILTAFGLFRIFANSTGATS